MKFLLVLLVFLFGAWLWRSGRQKNVDAKKQPTQKTPQDIVSCDLCGLHTPQAESVQGRKGTYCSRAHLDQAER
jgi:uncharacterized protein